MCAHFFQFFFELGYALADGTLVHFQLRFTGTAQAYAACRACSSATTTRLALKMCPLTSEARQVVFVLCKFHLQHTFTRMSMLSENIKDQRRPIQYTYVSSQSFL